MDDEEDIVIEEIPVFLSKNLKDSLYLFQYPTKMDLNIDPNESETKVVNSLVKPINDEVKIEFGLNSSSKYFDKFKAVQFAIASDGKTVNKNEKPSYRNGIMDRQTFISKKSIEDVNKYVVGIFQDNEIYLSPLKSILQLRPNFSYFDKQDKRNKEEEKNEDFNNSNDEEIKQVTVKFSRADTEKLNKVREKTYDFMMKKSKEEPWCETLWYNKNTPISELEKQKLFACSNESTEHVFNLKYEKYIEKLVKSDKLNENLETKIPSKVISRTKLKSLPLKEQLEVLLIDGKMLKFVDLMSILGKYDETLTAEKVLRTLPLVGVLIRGNWVPQSEILYPPESVSNFNGVSSELMVRGRDYILYKFSKQEYLHRPKVIITTQLPHDEVFEILSSVACLNAEKKWELLLPPDTIFEARYPELVQRQEMNWRAKENIFNEMEYEKSPKRVRKRSVKSESKS